MSEPETEHSDDDALPQFVTTLAPLGHQVGMHVIAALQHPNTVAVLTTVAAGNDGSQQVISIALDAGRWEQIRRLLESADREHTQRVQCVGFHCRYVDDGDGGGPKAA